MVVVVVAVVDVVDGVVVSAGVVVVVVAVVVVVVVVSSSLLLWLLLLLLLLLLLNGFIMSNTHVFMGCLLSFSLLGLFAKLCRFALTREARLVSSSQSRVRRAPQACVCTVMLLGKVARASKRQESLQIKYVCCCLLQR